MQVARSQRALALVLAFLLPFVGSCVEFHTWTPLERPWTNEKLAREHKVRVQRIDQPGVTLRGARIEQLSTGEHLVGGNADDPRVQVEIALDRVTSIHVWRTEFGRVVLVVVIVALLVSGIVTFDHSMSGALF